MLYTGARARAHTPSLLLLCAFVLRFGFAIVHDHITGLASNQYRNILFQPNWKYSQPIAVGPQKVHAHTSPVREKETHTHRKRTRDAIFPTPNNFFFSSFILAMHTQSKRRNIEQNAEMQPPKNAKLHRMKATNKKKSRERTREKKNVLRTTAFQPVYCLFMAQQQQAKSGKNRKRKS